MWQSPCQEWTCDVATILAIGMAVSVRYLVGASALEVLPPLACFVCGLTVQRLRLQNGSLVGRTTSVGFVPCSRASTR